MCSRNGSPRTGATLPQTAKGRESSKISGFTLLEILIALAILAIVASMVYASFEGSLKVMERVGNRTDIYRDARFILSRLSRDLSMAYRPEEGVMPESFFLGLDYAVDGRPYDSLRFTSLSHFRVIRDEPSSDLNVIEYRLEPAKEGEGWALVLREQGDLAGLLEEDHGGFVIGENIEGLNLRYFDGKTWFNSWDSVKQNDLPWVVEIEVGFHIPDGGKKLFKSWVELPLANKSRILPPG